MSRHLSLESVNADFDELFTPEERRRAVDWASSPEGREHLAAHAEALRSIPLPKEPRA